MTNTNCSECSGRPVRYDSTGEPRRCREDDRAAEACRGCSTSAASDLHETLRGLLPSTCSIRVDFDDDMAQWAVWVDDDIIGSGDACSEALADAVKTARAWK